MINNQRKKVLVIGGAGFIGSRLCKRLHEKDFSVTVLDNLSPQVHGGLKQPIKDITAFVRGDVRDKALLKNVLENQEIVVHMAGGH